MEDLQQLEESALGRVESLTSQQELNQLRSELKSELFAEIKNDLRSELKPELYAEVKNELRTDLKNELHLQIFPYLGYCLPRLEPQHE